MRQFKPSEKSITPRWEGIDNYLSEIDKYPKLTPDEEAELARQARAWDVAAREQLIKSNLKFVVSVAKKYYARWLELMDLVMAWNQWLIKAAGRFDETKGFKFISYAVRWIRQSILEFLTEEWSLIKPSANAYNLNNRIYETSERLAQILGRQPSELEIMEALDISEKDLKIALHVPHHSQIRSLDAPLGDSPDSATLWEMFSSWEFNADDGLKDEDTRIFVQQLLDTLPDQHRDILSHRYWLHPWSTPMKNTEIAELLWYSHERIRQICENAIKRLRMRAKRLM